LPFGYILKFTILDFGFSISKFAFKDCLPPDVVCCQANDVCRHADDVRHAADDVRLTANDVRREANDVRQTANNGRREANGVQQTANLIRLAPISNLGSEQKVMPQVFAPAEHLKIAPQ